MNKFDKQMGSEIILYASLYTATNNNKKRVKGKLEKYPYINIEVIDRISICLRRDDIRMDRQTPRNQNNVYNFAVGSIITHIFPVIICLLST